MFTVRGLYNRQRSLGLGTARRGAHGIWLSSSSSSSSFGGGARIDQSHTQSTHKCTHFFGFSDSGFKIGGFCVRRRGWNTSVWRDSKSHTRRELQHSAGGFSFDIVEHRQESLCVRFIFQFQSRVTNLMRECACVFQGYQTSGISKSDTQPRFVFVHMWRVGSGSAAFVNRQRSDFTQEVFQCFHRIITHRGF